VIPTLPFGHTGHESSRLIFGAAALLEANEAKSARALEMVLESGINHLDVAASYGDAELWVGRWMPEHRGRFFLASKTGERSYSAAREQIRRSLERLQTDRLDLIQLHNLVKEEEWEQALGEDGALRAAIEARDEGLVRFIGVTGHGTRVAAMHSRSLERFEFASVLLPCNGPMLAQPEYAAEFESLLATCRERGVAVQTIKAVARRRWAEGQTPDTTTWYEPLRTQDAIDHAVHGVLARDDVFLNTASDLDVLERTLDAAQRFFAGGASDDAALRDALAAEQASALFVRGYAA
jgi:aryl-alcohol dehydrogenase-like predicted oxidoreductase